MKKKFLSTTFLILSLLMINVLIFNKYTDKSIVVAESFNGWKEEGNERYFFQNSKKFTGEYQNKYFVNGKYANGVYNGTLYKNGDISTNAYVGEIFYGSDGKPANGWYDDGSNWYFFQNGKKHNGYGIDANGKRYFVDGKYANGIYGGKLYKDGIESKGRTYVNGIFYDENISPADGWYDDGDAWYFFKDGKKYTGKAVDGNGEMYFVKGKYANAYIDGIFYSEGKIANWWCDDGNA